MFKNLSVDEVKRDIMRMLLNEEFEKGSLIKRSRMIYNLIINENLTKLIEASIKS